jgi:hypothetical protein
MPIFVFAIDRGSLTAAAPGGHRLIGFVQCRAEDRTPVGPDGEQIVRLPPSWRGIGRSPSRAMTSSRNPA